MKTSICAIIKDEHLFLEEWIEWHLGLGFNAIHLFEDKGSKSHEEICKKYSNVYLRRYEDDEQVQKLLEAQGSSHTQLVLYTWFSENYKDTYDWCAFIDLDEFVMFSNSYDLSKLCKEFEPHSAVLLNWKMMGASGRISKPTCGIIEAYTQECDFCDNDRMWAYKSFVNLKRFQGFHDLHRAINSVNTHHSSNQLDLYYNKVWLNHYFTKSLEDWEDRIFKRGGTLNGHRTFSQFFQCNKNMSYLEDLIYTEKIPNGTYWLNKSKGLISGGNVGKIQLLNFNYQRLNTNKSLSESERLKISIDDAKILGFNNQKDTGKYIHIIWLGMKNFPEVVLHCMESWKKFITSDFTVCFWTENSVDLSHPFVRDAYSDNNFAFAADYLRLSLIYTYGGIYLDTDIELIKPLTEVDNNFFAIESVFNTIGPGLGFGATKNNEIIKDLCSIYDRLHYTRGGEYKQKIIINSLVTNYFISRGYVFEDKLQNFLGFTFYPTDYFSPKHFFDKTVTITENTISIHHYTCLWH